MSITSFSIRAIVGEAVGISAERAGRRGVKLVSQIARDVPNSLAGDPGRLRQILVNLIDNAVKFTQYREVLVSVRSVEKIEDTILIYCEVKDTCIGIAPVLGFPLPKPIHLEGARTSEAGGTGLGLAIAKQLVELQRGELGVTSDTGFGSTFWFKIPFKQRPVGDTGVPGPSGVHDEAQESGRLLLRVLLVEDNLDNQDVSRTMLEKLGCLVTSAENGLLALDELERNRFDLVLMDCRMPEMDGYLATGLIRERERAGAAALGPAHIPIIAVTALALEGDRERCLAAGMDDYLSKPVTMKKLRAALGRWQPVLGEALS
jgi:CheY-like chemotaxis protein